MRIVLGLVASLGAALTGCNNFTEHRLATFAAAMSVPRTVDAVPTIPNDAVPPDMPWMVPYARLHGDFFDAGPEGHCLKFRHEIADRDWRPDVIIYSPAGSAFAGTVNNYVGFGMSVSNAVYRPQADAYCMRLCPVSLGVGLDRDQMVVDVAESARACGIQEGDTLLSVNGKSSRPDQNGISELQSEALSLRPGDDIALVWIRPGTGRMSGTTKTLDPRRMPDSVASVLIPLPLRGFDYYGEPAKSRCDDPLAMPAGTAAGGK